MAAQFDAIGIVVSDLNESVRFYRILGVEFPNPEGGHLEATLPSGLRFMMDTEEVVLSFRPEWKRQIGNSMGLAFLCSDAKSVDSTYAAVIEAGFKGEKEPWDAFWGQRYAQVSDPDGHSIDLFAPLES